ncbi:PQQ-binding-like beta-propeller repeat protein [Streptomyces griseoviridis]|uniref:Serine/threonine-protein kinase AfsK n=2 Tax=Streptomyces TaxID=1883 RepID=A0A3Q9KQ11_STRGD|nr:MULTISPECIES: serine/threonine-protein kinase [Streptomyces]AZS86647.1 serine/threonine protein kinase [Streptomyces griseoviridis]MDH6699892.1 outer membrane protein assembly factor BamB/tRNA A-37 threonylcarbamoyl transferase component Bud32 [Streptomyces sp. MAA16]MDT0471018.1 serine/threonine-protein kinase [Streptomyces sp. DSM 41014]QCN86491.1 serine/threonine protein kinase [Streptomyces griseoviridis]
MVDQLTQHDPRRIGPFEVLGRLGAGGMGLVYLARSASGRRVAIKTVRTELAEDQLFRVRFTREVEAARAVSGFYTAAVVDADPRAAVPWLATAYVPAPSLEEIVNECGPMPAQAVRWLAAGVAEALQSIHGAGLVHRDLKPSNVLVVEDGPRVIDFGIASGVSNTRLTMTNVAVGTPAYMSPEQAKDSRSVTGASDVFSLGSMLVFAATGHPPFHGANPVETVFMLLREEPDLEGLPDELRPLIDSCMQMEATGRPNPADLQSQLAPHLFGSGSDDSGTASAWLPERAVGLIEARRNGRPAPKPGQPPARGAGAARPAPLPIPPPPSHDPVVPAPPVPVGAPAPGPVRLAGAQVPIGPGPRVSDVRAAAVKAPPPESALAASWSKPRPGVNGADPVVPAPPALPPETVNGAWRPWRFRMSNDVWGTPSVDGDLVYVTSFEVHALDVATGRRRFKTRDVAWSMAVADGRIHASDGPTLFALEAREGADLWRLSTDAWVYSIQADRGTVVTGSRGGGVQAWEASSGQKLWEATGCQTDFESPEAGPAVHEGTVYIWQDARLRALDARTGDERWSYPIGDAASCGGVPVRLTHAPDGYVYVSAGTRVLAIEVAGGHVKWHFEAPAAFLSPPAFVPGPAVTGGGVYLADYLGTVYALDAADGRDRWRIATESRASIDPVLVAAGHVHVGSGKGLYTLDAVTGTPKWRFQSGGDIVGAPAVAEGRIHFGSTDHLLYTLKADDGRLRWKLATGGEITGSPVVRDGVVYACSKDRCVYALDAEKGTGTARTA